MANTPRGVSSVDRLDVAVEPASGNLEAAVVSSLLNGVSAVFSAGCLHVRGLGDPVRWPSNGDQGCPAKQAHAKGEAPGKST